MNAGRLFFVGYMVLSLSLGAHSALPDLKLKRINPQTTLIGQEHTAQDQVMIDEPGRSSPPTPHRWEKLRAFVAAFVEKMKVNAKKNIRERNNSQDPGFYVKVKKIGEYRVNMEPVTIEVNSPPPNIFQLRKYATPIYEVFEEIGLVPYVKPAAERSGMGHAHLGGATLKESPFYLFPNLLPNLLVYLHNNPAALFALSEAYDMGENSNMETYHHGPRQKEFTEAVEDYHKWWAEHPRKRAAEGLARFVKIIRRTSIVPFEHYRYVNFERLSELNTSKDSLKEQAELTARTVEVRVIRPYKTVDHAEAVGIYLLKLLDYLSAPKMLLKVRQVTREDFQYYYSGTEIATNWLQVKKDIGYEHPLVDEMVQEYVDNVRLRTFASQGLPQGAELSAAYSKKEDKDKRYEVRIPVKNNREEVPVLALNKLQIPLKKIEYPGQSYWVGMFHIADYKIEKTALQAGKAQFIVGERAAEFPLRVIKSDRAPKYVPPPKTSSTSSTSMASGNYSPRVPEPPQMKAAEAIAILADKESSYQKAVVAYKEFNHHATQVTMEFLEAPLTTEFAKNLLNADNIFVRMKAYMHLFTVADFKPTTDDLRAISKALDNSNFTDRQVFFSRVAARMLYLSRTDSFIVDSELRSTVRSDSDIATRTYALAALIANGVTKVPNVEDEAKRTIRELRRQRGKPQIVDTSAMIDFFLQVTADRKPAVLPRGPVFSCEAVF